MECVIEGSANEHVVWKNVLIEKCKKTVFAGFNGSNIAREIFECGAKIAARFAKNPPIDSISIAVVLISLWLHMSKNMLVKSWII